MKHAIAKRVGDATQGEIAPPSDLAADLIRINLELADTFCKLALDAPERGREHRVDARRALDAAVHAFANINMEAKELDALITRIEEVKALLESLEAGGSTHSSC